MDNKTLIVSLLAICVFTRLFLQLRTIFFSQRYTGNKQKINNAEKLELAFLTLLILIAIMYKLISS